MAHVILHKEGAYQIYTTIADGPCFEEALSLAQLKMYIQQELGEAGLRELPQHLERAHRTGSSSAFGLTLEEVLATNRAGPKETPLSVEDFVRRFLTLPSAPLPVRLEE